LPNNSESPKKLPFTVAFLLPTGILRLLSLFHRKLAAYCLKFDEPETAHLTVKYLGYSSEKFPESHVIGLIPQIAEIARPFLPIDISIRGLDIFKQHAHADPVVFIKVLDCEKLFLLHLALQRGLGNSIDKFPHADGENFKPHITLSKKIDLQKIEPLKKIIFRSKKMAKRHFRLEKLALLTPEAIFPIFLAKKS